MKRVICIAMAAIMLFSMLSICINAQTFIYDDTYTLGNADGSDDRSINAKDSSLIKSYVLGREGADEIIDFDAADINGDGIINSKDTYCVKAAISGTLDLKKFEGDKQLKTLTIGGVDISEFCIKLDEKSDSMSNAYFSARTLQKYVEEATGVHLDIVYGEYTGEHAIIINAIDRFSEFGEELGNENYIYEVKDGNLQLYGAYRGNMYAVYEIIEKYLGFRFYDNEYTFLYKQKNVDIPDGTYVYFKPYLKLRHTGHAYSLESYYLPSRQNQSRSDMATAQPEYGTFYGYQFCNAHSFGLYWRMATGTMPDESYGTLAQRYDAQYNSGEQKDELGWQPCATDPEVYKVLFKGMIDTIERIQSWSGFAWSYKFKIDGEPTDYVKSGQPTISFSLCDNEVYCNCRNCRIKKHTEKASGLYIDMANQAARDLQEYYPGLRVHCILYNHGIPDNVRPDKNVIVYYCGQGCNNHFLGTDECGDCMGQLKKENNVITNESLKAWGQFCKESGAELWYWYYGVQYHYVLVDLPNVLNLYHDYKFLYEECNCSGINYEGGGRTYGFGLLKTYLSTKMMWNPTMSYEEYIGHLKEYLYMYYGDGAEKLYEFILMMNESGDRCGTCFISNYDRPGDMYSIDYMCENYEYMRNLLTDALSMAKRPEYKTRLETMISCFDFLGLSYVYYDMYRDGDDTQRATYVRRYRNMMDYFRNHNMSVFSDSQTFTLPSGYDYSTNPMLQIYGSERNGKLYSEGSRRPEVNKFFETGVKPQDQN